MSMPHFRDIAYLRQDIQNTLDPRSDDIESWKIRYTALKNLFDTFYYNQVPDAFVDQMNALSLMIANTSISLKQRMISAVPYIVGGIGVATAKVVNDATTMFPICIAIAVSAFAFYYFINHLYSTHFRTDNIKVLLLKAEIKRYKATKALYDEATNTVVNGKTGEWNIKLVDEGVAAKFGGVCCQDTRTIELHSKDPFHVLLRTLLFELTNAVSSPKFLSINTAAKKREISCEQYAYAMEEVEFEGTKKCHSILQALQKERPSGIWLHPEIDWYSKMNWNFGFAYHWFLIKNSSHTQYYRDGYYAMHGRSA